MPAKRRADGSVIGAPKCPICGTPWMFLLFEGTGRDQWKCGPNNHRFNVATGQKLGLALPMVGPEENANGVRKGMKRNVPIPDGGA